MPAVYSIIQRSDDTIKWLGVQHDLWNFLLPLGSSVLASHVEPTVTTVCTGYCGAWVPLGGMRSSNGWRARINECC